MEKSEQINDLAAALAKAQGEFPPVEKTGNNPFLKSKYVTLDGIIEATRKPLSAVGLSFVQMLDAEGDSSPVLTTMLMHSSGQWLSSQVAVRAVSGKGTNALQQLGGAITYMKRYAIAAMLGVSSDEDMDGNDQRQTGRKSAAKKPPRTTQAQASVSGDAFRSVDDAIRWAMDQGAFEVEKHARNSWAKMWRDNTPKGIVEASPFWREKVASKLSDIEPGLSKAKPVNDILNPDEPGTEL